MRHVLILMGSHWPTCVCVLKVGQCLKGHYIKCLQTQLTHFSHLCCDFCLKKRHVQAHGLDFDISLIMCPSILEHQNAR